MQRLSTCSSRRNSFNRFMLHYNFPAVPASRINSFVAPAAAKWPTAFLLARPRPKPASRRERELSPMPMRLVFSDIPRIQRFSSSMATVLRPVSLPALNDAGVPMKLPARWGIAMGLVGWRGPQVFDSQRNSAGAEDHYGDMDLKSRARATASPLCNMDIKVLGHQHANECAPSSPRAPAQRSPSGKSLDIMEKRLHEGLKKVPPTLPALFKRKSLRTNLDLIGCRAGKKIAPSSKPRPVKNRRPRRRPSVHTSLHRGAGGDAALACAAMSPPKQPKIGKNLSCAEVLVSPSPSFGAFVELFPGYRRPSCTSGVNPPSHPHPPDVRD